MNKYVEVLGAEDPSQFMGLTAEQSQALAASDRPFANLRLATNWVITLFPTPASAEIEGMDFETYERFIVGASTTDPRPLLAAEEKIAPVIDEAGSSGSSPTTHTPAVSWLSSSTSRAAAR